MTWIPIEHCCFESVCAAAAALVYKVIEEWLLVGSSTITQPTMSSAAQAIFTQHTLRAVAQFGRYRPLPAVCALQHKLLRLLMWLPATWAGNTAPAAPRTPTSSGTAARRLNLGTGPHVHAALSTKQTRAQGGSQQQHHASAQPEDLGRKGTPCLPCSQSPPSDTGTDTGTDTDIDTGTDTGTDTGAHTASSAAATAVVTETGAAAAHASCGLRSFDPLGPLGTLGCDASLPPLPASWARQWVRADLLALIEASALTPRPHADAEPDAATNTAAKAGQRALLQEQTRRRIKQLLGRLTTA